MNAAEAYERYLVPAIFIPMGDDLIERADPKPGGRALDLACGTGVLARRLVDRGHTVVGVDRSAAMLEVARSKCARAQWHEADVTALPLPEASFDDVLCQQVLQFIDDRVRMLGEVRRVLRPSGRLALNVFTRIEDQPGFHALTKALETHVGQAAAATRRQIFCFPEADELRRVAEHAGLREVEVTVVEKPVRFPSIADFVERQLASWKPEAVAAVTPAIREAMVEDMVEELIGFEGPTGFECEMRWNVLTARR